MSQPSPFRTCWKNGCLWYHGEGILFMSNSFECAVGKRLTRSSFPELIEQVVLQAYTICSIYTHMMACAFNMALGTACTKAIHPIHSSLQGQCQLSNINRLQPDPCLKPPNTNTSELFLKSPHVATDGHATLNIAVTRQKMHDQAFRTGSLCLNLNAYNNKERQNH